MYPEGIMNYTIKLWRGICIYEPGYGGDENRGKILGDEIVIFSQRS